MEKKIDNGRQWRVFGGIVAMVVGAICLVAAVPGQAGATAGGPPGNNGTVKMDRMVFDDLPNNEPHVGCVFQVDFYGYDAGDLFAEVTFEVVPPTANPAETIVHDTHIFIGEDDNSGGGSTAGLDASRTYDLSSLLAKFTPQDQQGWHVKLTIDADGSQGADVKHKEFWVSGCETPPTTSTSTTEAPTTSTTEAPTTTTEAPTTTSESTTSTTQAPTTSVSVTPESSTTVASTTSSSIGSTTVPVTPESSTTMAPASTAAPSSSTTASIQPTAGTLPNTGANDTGLFVAAGLALLIGGAALLGSAQLARRSED